MVNFSPAMVSPLGVGQKTAPNHLAEGKHLMFKSSNTLRTGLAVVGLALVASASAQAWPTYGDNPPTVRVPYSLTDIQTSDGATRLASRIRRAAASVCNEEDPFLRSSVSFERCRGEAIRRASAQVNAPMVAQALGVTPAPIVQAAR
jgi:UrcA family protein